MTTSKIEPEIHIPSPSSSTITAAWVVTLLVSSLGDAIWFELVAHVPLWLLWAKVGLLVVLICLGWGWKPIKVLRPFFIMLLAITALIKVNSWLLDSPVLLAWQNQQPFTVAALAVQLIEMAVALLLIAALFLLRKRREEYFLVRGDRHAMSEPIKWLGQKSPNPLWRFGLVFTLVVVTAQFFMFILPLSSSTDTLQSLIPLFPVILLLAVSNGFNEEIIFRAAPISPVFEVVGKSNAIWMAAILFGLSHYIGGIPSGIPGVVITTFLGWFFGKCMLDSKGLFWPWLFHTLQDILPFTLMTLTSLSNSAR